MKRLVQIAVLLLLLCQVQAQIPLFPEATSEVNTPLEETDEAIALAYRAYEAYVINSKLVLADGEDLSRAFLSGFGMDSKIPQDYMFGQKANVLVSPSKYVSDFFALVQNRPFDVDTRLLPERTTVSNIGDGQNKRVKMVVERTYSNQFRDGQLHVLNRPIKRQMIITFIVINDLAVEIDAIRLEKRKDNSVEKSESKNWVANVSIGFGLGKNGFTESTTLQGISEVKIDVNSFNLGLSRRFRPFYSSGALGARTSLLIGVGIDRLSFSTPMMTLSAQEFDYLEEDDVILLATGVSISDAQNSEDFVRKVQVDYAPHSFSQTSLELSAALSFRLNLNGKMNSLVETGFGLRLGGQTSTEIARVSDYQVTYSEGPFEDTPVLIDSEGVSYGGLFEAYDDPYGIYDVANDVAKVSNSAQVITRPFIDFRFIESKEFDSFDLGLVLSMRSYLGDLIERDKSNISLSRASREGVSPVFAFSDKVTPTILNIGLRLNF